MKNLSHNQIAQVKTLKPWTPTIFHGNTKKVGSLSVAEIKEIVSKKIKREQAKISVYNKTPIQITMECLKNSLERKDTNYFKVMIEGNSGIYYASPAYGHSDYNKRRLFDKNEYNLKLMHIFNKIVNK